MTKNSPSSSDPGPSIVLKRSLPKRSLPKGSLEDYTARRLGCELSALARGKISVIDAKAPDDKNFLDCGAFEKKDVLSVTLFNGSTVVRKNKNPTKAAQDFLDNHLKDITDFEKLKRSSLVTFKPEHVETYYYLFDKADFTGFTHQENIEIRVLTEADGGLMKSFHSDVPEGIRWFVEIDHPIVFGLFYMGKLVSVASHFLFEKERISAGGVITHPDFRGKKFGKAVVSRLFSWSIANGWAIEWSTWEANIASQRLALSFGLKPFLVEYDLKTSSA